MKYIILFLLVVGSFNAFCQDVSKKENTLFIVDSIPVIDEPEAGLGELSQTDIDHIKVITNKEEISKFGFDNIDKIIQIFTKEYTARPDSLKRVISTKLMIRKDGIWYLKNALTPYTGRFIDYFFNGKKEGEGYLKDGVVNGLRVVYYQNGNKSYFRNFVNGIANGYSEEYYQNGALKQKGSFKNGKDDGLWVDLYSTGKIKRQATFLNDKIQISDQEKHFYDMQDKALQLMKEENYRAAVKKLDDAIKLNPEYSDTYFYRGTAKLDDMKFDEAITDFDKAIELEPLYMEAVSNRAFARLRKFQLKNSRTISKNSAVTILASKDKVEIPPDELKKICADLNLGYNLGDHKEMVLDSIKTYCNN